MKLKIILYIILALLLDACSDDAVQQTVVTGTRTLPVTLSFSANVMSSPLVRGVGDPGEGDLFEMPRYVYLYVFGYASTDKTGTPHLLQPATGNPVILSNNPDDWSVNSTGNIYTYNHTIDILVGDANNFRSGETYAVASIEPIDNITPVGHDDVAKLTDLKNKTFDLPKVCFTASERNDGTAPDIATSQRMRERFLKNLYSSPSNLYYEWKNNSYTIENGEYKILTDRTPDAQYYGTVLDAGSKIPHVSMVLYHVAARLDVMWNVQKDNDGHENTERRVTGIKINRLKSRNCKLFEPTNNMLAAGDGYTEVFMPYDNTNASVFWQGREVRYVIQQGNNNIPLVGNIQLNGNTEYPVNATIGVTTPYKDIFCGWLRGYIKL